MRGCFLLGQRYFNTVTTIRYFVTAATQYVVTTTPQCLVTIIDIWTTELHQTYYVRVGVIDGQHLSTRNPPLPPPRGSQPHKMWQPWATGSDRGCHLTLLSYIRTYSRHIKCMQSDSWRCVSIRMDEFTASRHGVFDIRNTAKNINSHPTTKAAAVLVAASYHNYRDRHTRA